MAAAASVRGSNARFALAASSVAAAAAAMVVLASQANDEMLDYGVGVVPAAVPWLAAALSVAMAAVGASERRAASTGASLLMVVLAVATVWSVAMLPFDALRVVGLVPLPLSIAGLSLRLFLLAAGVSAVVPVLRARRATQPRCPACGRVVPGRLDAMPRWPVATAVVFALPYPVLRIAWALGGTFGTTGEPLDLDPVIAWGAAVVGAMLVAFAALLLVGKGPLWGRMLLGLGGALAGMALTVVGGLGAARVASELATEGLGSSQGELMTWTFLLVYGSWFVAGLGVIVGGWRYWAHRREDCPVCRSRLGR